MFFKYLSTFLFIVFKLKAHILKQNNLFYCQKMTETKDRNQFQSVLIFQYKNFLCNYGDLICFPFNYSSSRQSNVNTWLLDTLIMPKKDSKKNGDNLISHTILSENANHNVLECTDHEPQFKLFVCFKCRAIKVKGILENKIKQKSFFYFLDIWTFSNLSSYWR